MSDRGRSQSPAESEDLDVGRVVGVHGVRGALRVLLHGETDALASGATVILRSKKGEVVRRAEVTRAAPKPGSRIVRLWLGGLDRCEDAEALRDMQVWVSRESLPELEEGEYYLADAIGSTVTKGDRALGKVVGLTSNSVQDVFEVEWRDALGRAHAWLLPALPEFIVEIGEDQVEVDLPPGFLPEALETNEAL